ncbi:MAG: exopolyphosphatase [Idiomarina sp.]|nr:exopolyphosphatase [Idiomarina sp.]
MNEHIPNLDEVTPPDAPLFAALDIGSNSFHLITARVVNQTLQPLVRFKQKVQLAAGLKKNGKLSQKAMERGLEALVLCAQRLEGFSPERVRIVATHTLREATNSEVFIARAAALIPFPIEIILGHEEARLIYQGVAQTSASDQQRLVVDIGGGSTEIISGHKFEPDFLASRTMGSVSFTERYFKGGRISPKRFKEAEVEARRELEPVAQTLRKFHHNSVFGTSGTIKAIAQWVSQRDRTAADQVTREQLHQCKTELLQIRNIEHLSTAAIDSDRKPLIAAGVAILLAVMEELDIQTLVAHDSALREGVLYELADSILHHRDVKQRTIESLASRYLVDKDQAIRVQQTAFDMLSQVEREWSLGDAEWQRLIGWGALLHEVGLHINSSSIQKHSGYILQHADMPGFNREEQRFVASLVRHFRKKIRMDDIPLLHLYEQHQLHRLIAILRLAVLFNTDRQPSQLLLQTQAKNDTLLLTLTPQGRENPMLNGDLVSEQIQQAKLGIALRFE